MCWGKVRNESGGRTLLRPMRLAPRSGRIERQHNRQMRRELRLKLTTMTQVSVDGVMQETVARRMRTAWTDSSAAAGPCGWATLKTFINQTYQGADAFLFGRRGLRALRRRLWRPGAGSRRGGRSGPPPDRCSLEHEAQYRASTTLTEARWANTTHLYARRALWRSDRCHEAAPMAP